MQARNKTTAGYHLLMLLSVIDEELHPNEDMVIREFLVEEYPPPIPINLDAEMEILSTLLPAEYEQHFDRMQLDFYNDSTHEERVRLLDFAIGLIKADGKLHQMENAFLRKLLVGWKMVKDKKSKNSDS